PASAVELQNYDAVILANVPRGPGGLSDDQGRALAAYVHDMGGGLVVIGGPDALGAGGWQGTRLEEILPVDMDVPAKRAIPKGALTLIMHACEFQDGNYWGIQCGIKAMEVLNARDEIGVVSFGMGGSVWDYPLSLKEDGSKVGAALKGLNVGDMPDFDDSVRLALEGGRGSIGLLQSDAKNKHMIIISDGDPSPPGADLIAKANAEKITISTVSVYPHDQSDKGLPPTMRMIADRTGGRAYGPINGNFSQLPQIFIKEATIVRRSLIQEKNDGLVVGNQETTSEVLKGLPVTLPPVYGMVLTSKKASPQVEMPLAAGPEGDPLLAHWQTGLGRSLVYTSDAHTKWGRDWLSEWNYYDKFWAQAVRQVARPAESADFDVRVSNEGGRGRIVVEALNTENQFRNGLTIRGTVLGPDMKPVDVRLVQTAPGTYETAFDAAVTGNYVVGLSYGGADGQSGILRSGTVVNASPELRSLKSNEAVLKQIAERTGGRYYDKPFDASQVALFDRSSLPQRISPVPVWDLLLPVLIGLLLLDVAVRRIAWDWASVQRARAGAVDYIRSFTTPRKVETTGSVDALRRVREGGAAAQTEQRPITPDRARKFEAREDVQGDISQVVGGATKEPAKPKTPAKPVPTGATEQGGHTNSLLEAKRRAQQKIRDQEEGK
ncbi:MAG TPA: glutamine amidotransferase, partial [Tepidisphaeraceae bacterium]